MVVLEQLRTANREAILTLAHQHGARNLRIFGSVARGEQKPDSDLDLLVEWESGRTLLDHVGLVQDLESLLGVKVHLGTEKSLHWYLRENILAAAVPL
ncbi:MAG: nucleotidyltransferase family protein [Bryobacter sp.]|nr:nucleotidyltransferase family protein [Bryobacter sp.]